MITISPTIAWFIAAALVLALELFLTTAYLLAVSFGLAAGAIAAWAGFGFSGQILACAAAVALGCVAVLIYKKKFSGRKDDSMRLQNLDEGRLVRVDSVGSDGLAVVTYRGATWIARPGSASNLTPGVWTIESVDGTQLILGERRGS